MIFKEPCSLAYVSGACNSNPFAADWGSNNKICVAIEDAVTILQPDLNAEPPSRLETTLFAHTKRVNAVKWIQNLDGHFQNSFVSGSVDTTTIVWIWEGEDYVPKFPLKGHKDAVIDVKGISFKLNNETNCVIIASMSLDCLIVWKKTDHDADFCLLNTFDFPQIGLGVSGISFSFLPFSRSLIMVCPKKFVDLCLYVSSSTLEEKDPQGFQEKLIVSGHSNWINDVALTYIELGKILLLASSSHDCSIRVWKIVRKDESESHLGMQEHAFFVDDKRFAIITWSILHGHDQWIYTLQWKHFENEIKEEDKIKLLSVSADKTLVIWSRDLAADTWVENYRLGDLGGNLSGFLGGEFDPTGLFVMAHDLLGAFHIWKYNKSSDSWSSKVLPGGHFDEVTDLQWDPEGKYLVTSSADKTTRLHAPYQQEINRWYELARPQTHGHIISCITVLPEFRFVSGATEKELRSFVAPKSFIKNFSLCSPLSNIDESKYPHNSAILPSLDLSNKPSHEAENRRIEKLSSSDEALSRVIPTEDELSRMTLWPEVQKLYYHPNEISCISSTLDGSIFASACKANSSKEASIAIWAVKTWNDIQKIQELWFHQLTVTQLMFSPCGLFLLSVSRDRSWSLYKRSVSDEKTFFELISCSSKTNILHKRQLNCCAWSHDSKFFATGSRDGKLVIWSLNQDYSLNSSNSEESKDPTNNFSSRYILSVTDENVCSISFAPQLTNSSEYLIAVGFGTGKIALYLWSEINLECSIWQTLGGNMAHNKSIARVVFRPAVGKTSQFQLASGGADRLVKIYLINDTTS